MSSSSRVGFAVTSFVLACATMISSATSRVIDLDRRCALDDLDDQYMVRSTTTRRTRPRSRRSNLWGASRVLSCPGTRSCSCAGNAPLETFKAFETFGAGSSFYVLSTRATNRATIPGGTSLTGLKGDDERVFLHCGTTLVVPTTILWRSRALSSSVCVRIAR